MQRMSPPPTILSPPCPSAIRLASAHNAAHAAPNAAPEATSPTPPTASRNTVPAPPTIQQVSRGITRTARSHATASSSAAQSARRHAAPTATSMLCPGSAAHHAPAVHPHTAPNAREHAMREERETPPSQEPPRDATRASKTSTQTGSDRNASTAPAGATARAAIEADESIARAEPAMPSPSRIDRSVQARRRRGRFGQPSAQSGPR